MVLKYPQVFGLVNSNYLDLLQVVRKHFCPLACLPWIVTDPAELHLIQARCSASTFHRRKIQLKVPRHRKKIIFWTRATNDLEYPEGMAVNYLSCQICVHHQLSGNIRPNAWLQTTTSGNKLSSLGGKAY